MSGERLAVRLVVNADGFGASPAVCRGVLRAHREGIVTSTSVIGTCRDLQDVKAQLDGAPELGVGAHLTLVGGGPPIAGASAVRSLVDEQGNLPSHPGGILVAWAKGVMRADDVERELDAQVTRLLAAGLPLDHLSTQHHLGFLPTVGRAVESIARRHGIPGIRMAMERPSLAWIAEAPRGLAAAALGGLGWWTRRNLGALRHGPQSWGFVESGRLDDVRVLEILGRLGPGPHELLCHPIDYTGGPADGELRALLSPLVRHGIERRGIELCRWRDLF